MAVQYGSLFSPIAAASAGWMHMSGFALLRVVNLAAVFSGVYLQLTPVSSIASVYHMKSTAELDCLPYLMCAVNSVLWFIYGKLRGDMAIVWTNAIGIVLGVIYTSVFHFNCHSDVSRFRMLTYYQICVLGTGIVGLVFLTCPTSLCLFVLGTACAILQVITYAAPLSTIQKVLRERSTASMPEAVCFGAFVSSFVWSVYGLLVSDPYILLPNLIGFLCSFFQVWLLFRYRRWIYTPIKA